jgi:hypothetical protein
LLFEMGDVDGHGAVVLGNRVGRLERGRRRKWWECVGAGSGMERGGDAGWEREGIC